MSDVTQAIIGFFTFMILARKLNPEGYGIFNVLLALVSIFSVFAVNISASQVIIREVTLNPTTSSSLYKIVFPIRILSLLFAIVGLILYQIFTGDTNYGLIFATSLIVVATVVWDLAESIAFGHFITKWTTIISIVASIAWLIIVLLLPINGVTVDIVIWLYTIVFLIRGFIYIIISYSKFVKSNDELSNIKLNSILWMSMPFLWMRVVGIFGEQVPLLLLKGFSGATEVGYFSVGNRFVVPITIAITTGLRAVFPFMTKLYKEDKIQFSRMLLQGFSFVFIIGGTIATVLTLSSSIWITLIFGNSYQESINAFNYQAWFGVLLCFDLLLATVLASTYRQKTLAIITTIDVLIIFPLIYFGAKYGAEGMAIAKLTGAFITICYHIFVVSFVLKINLISKAFVLSVAYFMIFMLSSIFVSYDSIRLIIVGCIIIFYLFFKASPLRNLISIISIKIKQGIINNRKSGFSCTK